MDNAGVQGYKISISVAATVSLLTLPAKYLTVSQSPTGNKKVQYRNPCKCRESSPLYCENRFPPDAVITLVLILS